MYSFLFPSLLLVLVAEGRRDVEEVTCGSVMKLRNAKYNVRLHSHEVKYGSGSGQQSVTAVEDADDNNSYWQVVAKRGGGECPRGRPVKCGQTVRLLHLSTKSNLHSHHFQSPLTHNMEVSAFGSDADGDEGDNWVVQCGDTHWQRDAKVRFRHPVTDAFLHVNGETFGRPISGQYEVCGIAGQQSEKNQWYASEGVFIAPKDKKESGHDEL